MRLHCLPGGSSEIRYELALDTYLPGELRHGASEDFSFDYLPLLDKRLPSDDWRQPTLKKLKSAKVGDSKAAHDAAMRYKIEHGGLDARDGSKVAALFKLAQDIPGFAQQGDLVWDIQIIRMAEQVSDEIWISSRTGEGKSILQQPGDQLLSKPSDSSK